MAGLFGIGGSSAKTDRGNQLAAFGTLSGVSNYGVKSGESNLDTATKYFQDLLSGDPSKVAGAIAPETKVIQDQAGQKLKTLSEFSNRSGGTNATAQKVSTDQASAVQSLIDTLIPRAATELGILGTTQLNTGVSAADALGSLAGNARVNDAALQQKQQAAIIGALTSLASMGVNAETGGAGIGGFGEG